MHPKIILKSDNEPAIRQVVERVLGILKSEGVTASDEGSVPHDPQTNGAAESAVRLLKGTIKANLLSLERRLQARIPLDHPIMAWLAHYAAQVRTMRTRGPDGRTGFKGQEERRPRCA